jgi:DNA-directed RNA polymerase subunit RPC12/RpoP
MAIYECRDCKREEFVPRRYTLHFGKTSRCPRCGTYRLKGLKQRDKIDPIQGGFLNFLERLAGGKLFHCRYCRIQFYDRRRLASEVGPGEAGESQPEITSPSDTAKSGA